MHPDKAPAAAEWKNIQSLALGGEVLYGLTGDGRVLMAGNAAFGQEEALDWENIVSISASPYHVAGLKKDGTAIAAGWNEAYEEEDWGDVEKYADHLCKLKHLPDVVWVVDKSCKLLVESLNRRGIQNTDFVIANCRNRVTESSVVFYTPKAYSELARKAWKLLCYIKRHPGAEPRNFKQRCEVKFYEKSYRHLIK